MSIENVKREIVSNMSNAYFEGAFLDKSTIRYVMEDIIKAVENGSSKEDILSKINDVSKELYEEYND